ncbi:hypothetical protein HPP92_009558 [Vanilla planifolia]|uniref:Uncharacterized protein n=1 Tax=Vanilla planifolia TaxID=51239 RepID=A0A835V7I9_VANPL|nr:hypothetical protein HPP92_009558 [Vanilla planifolia]
MEACREGRVRVVTDANLGYQTSVGRGRGRGKGVKTSGHSFTLLSESHAGKLAATRRCLAETSFFVDATFPPLLLCSKVSIMVSPPIFSA